MSNNSISAKAVNLVDSDAKLAIVGSCTMTVMSTSGKHLDTILSDYDSNKIGADLIRRRFNGDLAVASGWRNDLIEIAEMCERYSYIFPRVIINYSMADGRLHIKKEDYSGVDIAFVMPVFTGKTFFSKMFGGLDIDNLNTIDEILAPLRQKASTTGDWDEHNIVWFDHTLQALKHRYVNGLDNSVVFTHSIEHATYIGAKYIVPLKYHPKANDFIKNRDARVKDLSPDKLEYMLRIGEANYNSVAATLVDNRLEMGSLIYLCILQFQGNIKLKLLHAQAITERQKMYIEKEEENRIKKRKQVIKKSDKDIVSKVLNVIPEGKGSEQ